MDKNLEAMRHSAAHLLGAAVLRLYPDAKLTIGPATDTGYYYDFDFSESKSRGDFSNEKSTSDFDPKSINREIDLKAIEKMMAKTLPAWDSFSTREVTADEAKEIFKNNPYKLELIDEIVKKGEKITLYKAGYFEDLCRGGHIENPSKEIGAFKLLSIAGAYWRGNEKNKMLTRIYGVVFPTEEELDEHLKMLEEAEKRDHKKLGKELGLFVFSETVGKGLPLFTPKGSTIRRELERFIVDEELKRGYLHVYTPDIAKIDLYKKSGHYPYYKDSMYAPITIEEDEFMLRPMTCPHHFELYLSRPHSYKELPMRFAELAKLYRFEKSGELMGLQRVRTFCLADAHIVTPKSKAEDEINGVLDLIEYIASVFSLEQGKDYHYRLSLGDRTDDKKYFKADESWDFAEDILRKVLKKRSAHFVEAPGEAAFYGPKIDVQMRNVNGKEDTAFTVQYDFVMPQRFSLSFINEEGADEQPVVIHRSSIGAIERVMAFLIEHYAGAFPMWLCPTQVVVLPVSDKFLLFASKVVDELKSSSIRVEIDNSNNTLGNKIREATLQKVPYMCIIGGQEEEKSKDGALTVTVRTREGKDLGQLRLNEFISQIQKEIETKH